MTTVAGIVMVNSVVVIVIVVVMVNGWKFMLMVAIIVGIIVGSVGRAWADLWRTRLLVLELLLLLLA